ncbi:MAG: NUDIX domain-containing protein [Bacteroidales bacterium]
MTDFSKNEFLPHIAYDSVIFGFSGKSLKILLMRYRNTDLYALPGGFVGQDEDLQAAVERGIEERTGLQSVFLEQFHTFGAAQRHDAAAMQQILEGNGFSLTKFAWMLKRFISISYYALLHIENVTLRPDTLCDSIDWYSLDELPPLMMDHAEIVHMALRTLRNNLDRKLVGVELLPEKFTMRELQEVYEAILGTPLRRTTFQRKMLSLELLERHEKRFTGQAHKAPYLYSFKRQ